MLTHIDIAIGSRMRVTSNIHVEGGIYTGAMGTVWAIIYLWNLPSYIENNGPLPTNFSILEDRDREIPIILLQMDGEDNETEKISYSCIPGVKRIIPFSAIAGQSTIKNKWKRYQIPLLPAFARTCHSVQGITAK